MNFARARPPNFDDVAAVFDVRGKPVLFAYGDTIYAPSGVTTVAPHLMAHETAHSLRQGGDPEGWWKKYLTDPEFRLDEEKIGHMAEYQNLCARFPSRSDRRRHISLVASRLSSALYRYKITKDDARRFLENG